MPKRETDMTQKILIVEDSLQNMKVLRMTLRAHGYTFLETNNGETALEMAVRDKPDLIIMDIQLPKVSGLETIKRLRQMSTFRHIPIIVVTAYAMKGDKEKAIKAGCDTYLPKPINTRQLPRLVAKLLLKRKQGNFSCSGVDQ